MDDNKPERGGVEHSEVRPLEYGDVVVVVGAVGDGSAPESNVVSISRIRQIHFENGGIILDSLSDEAKKAFPHVDSRETTGFVEPDLVVPFSKLPDGSKEVVAGELGKGDTVYIQISDTDTEDRYIEARYRKYDGDFEAISVEVEASSGVRGNLMVVEQEKVFV